MFTYMASGVHFIGGLLRLTEAYCRLTAGLLETYWRLAYSDLYADYLSDYEAGLRRFVCGLLRLAYSDLYSVQGAICHTAFRFALSTLHRYYTIDTITTTTRLEGR